LRRSQDLIEKPSIDKAPSTLAIGGRYILTPDIFDCIEKTQEGKGNEIQITDAIKLLSKKQPIYGYKFDGKRYDMGNKLDFLKTNVEFALKRKDLGSEFLTFLKEIIGKY